MAYAVIYARYSPRPNPQECDSIEFQVEKCKAYCRAHGLEVIAVFYDEAKSGKSMDDRPGLQKALSMTTRKGATFIFYSLSRISRSIIDSVKIADELRRNDCDMVSLTENINTRTAVGRAFYAFVAMIAQLEREMVSERTSEAMKHHQANGRRMGRKDRIPYGWKLDPDDEGRILADVGEQTVIGHILRLHEKGYDPINIAKLLDKFGIKPRMKNRRWYPMLIKKILVRAGVLPPHAAERATRAPRHRTRDQ